jgi:hypothetical protein
MRRWMYVPTDVCSCNPCLSVVQDAGGQMPAVADVVAAGGVARTSGANTNYNFNASVPAQRTGFLNILKEVSCWGMY